MSDLPKTLILSGAAVVAAFVLGQQIASLKLADRTITVRGAAEMQVTADLATWNLGVSGSADELKAAQAEVDSAIAKIRAFLEKQGIKPEEIENQNVSVSDARANQYNQANGPRFTISGGVTVRTTNLQGAQTAKNKLGDLVTSGVILTSSWGPNYTFSRLNDLKPELISKATAEALKSAEQFAKDSGESIGGIRRARQGSVEILGRDAFLGESEQANKVLRVVTTVDYDVR